MFEPPEDAQQIVVQLLAREFVECGEGLIHQEDPGIDRQRPRDGDALLHAARELVGIAVILPSSWSA